MEVHEMAERAPISFQTDTGRTVPRWARNVFFGGAIGLVVGLAVVFLLALFYGKSTGLTAGECAAFACTMTVFLSQPAAIGGMVAGAAAGAVVGGIAHLLRHS
jgi:hypothetical protein